MIIPRKRFLLKRLFFFFFNLLFIYYYFLFYPLKKLLLGERSTLLGEMLIEHCRFVYNIDMVMLSTMYANAM